MKIFAVRDSSGICSEPLMWLVYCPVGKTFFIELPDDADPTNIPMPLDAAYKKGVRTVGSEASMQWVRLRIVPPDRQNISQILADLKLQAYDEFKLLEYTKGHCSHDDYYLVRTSEAKLPEYLKIRLSRRVRDVMPMQDERMLVFFRNGESRICGLSLFYERPEFKPLLRREAQSSVSVMYEGYGINFGQCKAEVLYNELYSSGVSVPIAYDDVLEFIRNRLTDTAGAAKALGCSPQNINSMRKRGKMTPIITKEKYCLYAKTDIEQNKPA